MYLYFTEQHACKDAKPPTEEDVTAAVKGETQIIKVEGDQVQYIGPDGLWLNIKQAVMKPDGKHHFA